MANSYQGSCFCGAVEFEITGDPTVAGFCHCSDCTEWAAAPISAFTMFPPGSVRVTKGEDNVVTFNKTENSFRKFCKTCGGHVFTDLPVFGLEEIYPGVVPDLVHEPTVHLFYGSKTVAVKDGLPKFKDLPADFGGSGDMLSE